MRTSTGTSLLFGTSSVPAAAPCHRVRCSQMMSAPQDFPRHHDRHVTSAATPPTSICPSRAGRDPSGAVDGSALPAWPPRNRPRQRRSGIRLRMHSSRLRILMTLLVVAALAVPVTSSLPAQARTGTYTIALIRTSYSDATSFHTRQQITDAADEMTEYFSEMSNRQLTINFRIADAALTDTVSHYHDRCRAGGTETRNPCPPPLVQD